MYIGEGARVREKEHGESVRASAREGKGVGERERKGERGRAKERARRWVRLL